MRYFSVYILCCNGEYRSMNFAKAAGKNTPTLPFDFQLYRDRSFTYMRDQKKNTGSERTCQTPRTSNSTLSPTKKKRVASSTSVLTSTSSALMCQHAVKICKARARGYGPTSLFPHTASVWGGLLGAAQANAGVGWGGGEDCES